MTLSLYAATIPSKLQILRALDALLTKAEAFGTSKGMSEADVLGAKLADDMLPLGYQVKSAAVHSLGAIEGVRAGSFSPDMKPWPTTYEGLHAALHQAIAALEALDPAEVEGFVGKDTAFQFGQMTMPFTAEEFLLSFSQPNFYFHATVAYAILRHLGVQIGKRDFIGLPRMKRG